MKPKTVKAWAVRQSDGSLGPIAPTKMFDYEVPVRVVPESEYKRMMAAVKELEAIKNTSEAQPYTGGRVVRHGNDWKKGKVNRGK
jgi:hypothetical protein